MQSIIYSLNRLPKSIPIGFTGENHFRRICIDVGKWTGEYPNGIISAYVLRPNDSTALPVAISMVETLAVWEADAWATAKIGTAKIQWIITVDDSIVGKSPIVELDIRESLVLGEEPPEEPDPDWYEMLLQAIEEKQDALTAGSGIRIENNVISATGGGGGTSWGSISEKPFSTIGAGLKVVGNELQVDTADVVESDNTKPVTSAAVHVQIGNIEVLLSNI